ncbi:MAG: sodium-translocating pyrophosphatase [Myxococcales bacterium]|nr:sodium-translocating pyrophosphatase [Myxococcales bacterium]
MSMPKETLWAVVAGVIGLVFAAVTARRVLAKDRGNEKMIQIQDAIREGAMAFLGREYKVLSIFVVAVAALLTVGLTSSTIPGLGWKTAVSFVGGALCSVLCGFGGMRIATGANARTAQAASRSFNEALSVAFPGGVVMGMLVMSVGLVGLGGFFYLFAGTESSLHDAATILAGFSMGASSVALFARVGGGIYTKAADVGSDLVGKVEAGIPEDDPRNPGVIADNVGDNVGDVAGMGADLFESYIGAILGTMVLGAVAVSGKLEAAILPLLIAGAGIVVSILGTFLVRTKEGGNPQVALDLGSFGAAIVMLPISYVIIDFCVKSAAANNTPLILEVGAAPITTMALMYAIVAGLLSGVAIGMITGYYCSKGKRPVNSIVDQSKTGPATNIIAGIGVGFESTAIPIVLIAGAIFVANHFAGLYGVALAALGMLSTTGIQLAVDAYGPISDNAGGIAEMSGLPPEVRHRTDNLDAVGNTTAAIGKGFAIASAALAALSLFAAYRNIAFGPGEDLLLTNPEVLIGLLIGGMLPFLFSAMAMKAVGSAAMDMITEVRRQFREIPVLRSALSLVAKAEHEGRALTPDEDREVLAAGSKTEVERCVAISTQASIRRMIAPGILALVSPVIIGFWSRFALGGLLAGTLVTGVMLAIFMSNAGGAWDNAKKQVEDQKKDASQAVNTGKGSERHKAAVIGDTVGDPFKDTAGPSLNILIKLMTIVAVVIAPLLVKQKTDAAAPPPQVQKAEGKAAVK